MTFLLFPRLEKVRIDSIFIEPYAAIVSANSLRYFERTYLQDTALIRAAQLILALTIDRDEGHVSLSTSNLAQWNLSNCKETFLHGGKGTLCQS